jgi:uncharacterized integral membrane protein
MNGKVIGLIFLLVLLLIFVIQNTQAVAIKFLFWDWATSLAFTILLSFGIGVLLGWIIFILRPKGKKTGTPAASPVQEIRKP